MTFCKRLQYGLWLAVLGACAALGQTKPDIGRYTVGQLPTSRLNAQGVAGLCLETDGNGGVTLASCGTGGGGSGTVTSFSAGTLVPLFSTSVSNASTTPALSFTLSNAGAHLFLGNNTGTAGAPGYVSITTADLPGVFAQTIANVTHQWLNSYNATTGLFTQSQPAYTDLTGLPTLPTNTTGTVHQFFSAYNSSTGAFTKTQPDYSDLTGTPTLPANTTGTAHNFFTAYNSSTGAFTKAQPATSDLSDFPSQVGNSGKFLTTDGTTLSFGSPSGAGTVTSFSSGNLSPLFTASVATATSTPALSFSLSTAAAHSFFGNNTASTAAPGFQSIGNGDLPGSGAITLNTTSPLGGGGSVSLGNALTFTCTTCLTSVTAHNLLSATHGDTTTHTVLRGDLIAGIGASPTWTAVAKGGTNNYPKWNSSGDVVASTNPASGTGSPTSCTNQFVSAFTLNADAAPTSTCSTVAYSQVSGTPTLPVNTTGTAHQFFTAYNSSTGAFTKAQPDYSDLTGTPTLEYQTVQNAGTPLTQRPTLNFTGAGVSCSDNAVSTRTDCTITSGGGSGTVTNTAGSLTSGQIIKGNGGADIAVGDLSGDATTSGSTATTVAKVNGTSVPTNAAADQTLVTTASATGAWKSIPVCTDTAGNHLNYDTATHAFSCGTSSSGGGSFTGGTLTSELIFAASGTGAPSANIPSGTAPTTPAAGDIWRDSNGFNMVENASTQGLLEASTVGTAQTCDTNKVGFGNSSGAPAVCSSGGSPVPVVTTTGTQTVTNKTFDSTSTGPWPQLLGCTTPLASGATTVGPLTVSGSKILLPIIITGYAGADAASLQFNGSGGTAYQYRWLTSAGGTTPATTFTAGLTARSTDRIKVGAVTTTNSRNVDAVINNVASVTEKNVMFVNGMFGTASAASNDTLDLGNGAWVSGASTTINSISLISTSNMNAGSFMCAYKLMP